MPLAAAYSLNRVNVALRLLRQSYAAVSVSDFGPLALQAIQHKMAAAGKGRPYVNYVTAQIKRVSKWGVSQELVPAVVFQGLATVCGLKRGRSDAREPEPVEPVADEVVEATLAHLPPAIAAMVRVQRLTGCRPGEVCQLRPADMDRSGEVWEYRPAKHKTAYRGKPRLILIGPKAQEVLLPWLLRAPEDYCFSPAEKVDKWNAARKLERRSPMTPSQARRRRKRNPKHPPGDCYTTHSYTQVVRRAIRAVNQTRKKSGTDELPYWTPNQLRHSAATEIRKKYGGLEPVAAVLGHSHVNVSEVYAERNLSLAAEVMRNIG